MVYGFDFSIFVPINNNLKVSQMSIFNFSRKKIPKHIFLYLLPAHILKICSYKVVKRIFYSIVFRFHIIGVQVTIGRLGKYLSRY